MNATCCAGAVVQQQVVKLQQQLADLQSSFDEEHRKATLVTHSHQLAHAVTSQNCFSVVAGWSLHLRQHIGQVKGIVWPWLSSDSSTFATSKLEQCMLMIMQDMFRLQVLFFGDCHNAVECIGILDEYAFED